ncbi:MAG TPA: hypothetical protein VFH08_07115 [Chitinophagaceae bacterium]|nr:hypothetical protein [Chitinophagaceae bacterium]
MRKISSTSLFLFFSLLCFAQKTTIPVVSAPTFKKDTLNVKKFGAVADGNFLNTKAINDAVTTLNKQGGGVVLIPPRLWLTGPIVIKSNTNLHLAAGATLLFTGDWGNIFERYGAKLSSLDVAPSAANLANVSVYIIVDPDHTKDNPSPNYVTDKDVKSISDWMRAGGKLVLMSNDSANSDLEHFNKLAAVFGVTFTNKSINMVKNDLFEQGAAFPGDYNPIFNTAKKMYLKEVSVLNIKSPAKAIMMKDGDVIVATTNYGKGTEVSIGDPWFYSEYVDGRKLPAEFENFKAAEDLVRWLLMSKK